MSHYTDCFTPGRGGSIPLKSTDKREVQNIDLVYLNELQDELTVNDNTTDFNVTYCNEEECNQSEIVETVRNSKQFIYKSSKIDDNHESDCELRSSMIFDREIHDSEKQEDFKMDYVDNVYQNSHTQELDKDGYLKPVNLVHLQNLEPNLGHQDNALRSCIYPEIEVDTSTGRTVERRENIIRQESNQEYPSPASNADITEATLDTSHYNTIYDVQEFDKGRSINDIGCMITAKSRVIVALLVIILLLTSVTFFIITFIHLMTFKDGNVSNMWENLTNLDRKVDQLKYRSDINMEQLSNITELLRIYRDELMYIKKALALKEFSFDRSTLYRYIYMSSDNRTISTHRITNSTRGSGSGFQNYQGVRGTIQFTNFDITYFEVSVHYKIIGTVEISELVFQVGFSTEDTIDGHAYVWYHHESWSFHCAVNENGSLIELLYQVTGNTISPIKNVSLAIQNTSYSGRFGFYINGPKGEITIVDKQENNVLHTFEHIDFTKRLYPVFAVYDSGRFNTTLTLNIEP